MRSVFCGVWLLVGAAFGAAAKASDAAAESQTRYEIFMIGNSHSAGHHLPQMLEAMLKLQQPGAEVHVARAPDFAFLDEHLDNPRTRKHFGARQWTHVVLQAQKYSTTGLYRYSTAAAERWLRKIRDRGAKGVMFPEWARRDRDEETARIQSLHESIAANVPACVAPVGLVWQRVQADLPALRLHADDGNHANAVGSFLTAMTLLAVIRGEPPVLPVFTDLPIGAAEQKRLQDAVREVVQAQASARC